ncbi:MAG: nitrate reductase subunit beta, partial [Selenomonadaceae bacterium]|nr:nitrate reductase subunit beta [Selenomonadaceae bacterium]
MGILLYDMNGVLDAAKTDNPQMISAQMLGLIKDPNDPEVIESARREGVSEAVLNAAKVSPVYQLIKGWNLALPLHPEFRTLPMVWYIPPLSPITKKFEDKVYLPQSEAMRIPVKYLAELFTAGNTELILQTLQRLLDMRTVMRCKEVGEAPPQNLEFDVYEYEKMYKLLAIAKYSERIKLPAGLQGKTHEQLRELQGSAGYVCPGGFC